MPRSADLALEVQHAQKLDSRVIAVLNMDIVALALHTVGLAVKVAARPPVVLRPVVVVVVATLAVCQSMLPGTALCPTLIMVPAILVLVATAVFLPMLVLAVELQPLTPLLTTKHVEVATLATIRALPVATAGRLMGQEVQPLCKSLIAVQATVATPLVFLIPLTHHAIGVHQVTISILILILILSTMCVVEMLVQVTVCCPLLHLLAVQTKWVLYSL